MLEAELRGKISERRAPHERMEDVLTSHVFSLFKYCENLDLLRQFLGRARNLEGEHLDLGVPVDAEVVFWPKFRLEGQNQREPDVLISMVRDDGSRTVVEVEAKFLSGLSNIVLSPLETANASFCEDEPANPVEVKHQLADELCGLFCGRWDVKHSLFDGARTRVLLYVTAGLVMPFDDLEGAGESMRARSCAECPSKSTDIYWVSWRELHCLLTSTISEGCRGYNRTEQRLMSDLMQLLESRGLEKFRLLHDIEPVDSYQRFCSHVFWSGLEALTPYQPRVHHWSA